MDLIATQSVTRFESWPLRSQPWASSSHFAHIPLSPSSTISTGQRARAAMTYGWEGNRRSACHRTGHACVKDFRGLWSEEGRWASQLALLVTFRVEGSGNETRCALSVDLPWYLRYLYTFDRWQHRRRETPLARTSSSSCSCLQLPACSQAHFHTTSKPLVA